MNSFELNRTTYYVKDREVSHQFFQPIEEWAKPLNKRRVISPENFRLRGKIIPTMNLQSLLGSEIILYLVDICL